MNITSEEVSAFCAAIVAIIVVGGVIRIYFGQLNELKDKFTEELRGVSLRTEELIKALEMSTTQRIESALKATHDLAGTSQKQFNEINNTFARRDDFIDLRAEMRKGFENISTKLDRKTTA